jgi:hypothetical protein
LRNRPEARGARAFRRVQIDHRIRCFAAGIIELSGGMSLEELRRAGSELARDREPESSASLVRVDVWRTDDIRRYLSAAELSLELLQVLHASACHDDL